MTPVDVIRDLWVCVDCTQAIANGEYPEDEDRAAAIQAGESAEAPYYWVLDSARDDEDPSAAEITFSSSSCDCCDDSCAGARHRAALIKAAS